MSNLAVATSDWHITERVPVNRLPGYGSQQFDKIEWIFALCRQKEADLYIAGDIFDKAREKRQLVGRYLSLFAKYHDVSVVACAGNHDQAHHRLNLTDTNIDLLYSADAITRSVPGIDIVTMDWGAEIPEYSKVLIAHFCVTQKHNPFIDHSVVSKRFLDMTTADIVITGDYHEAHHLEEGGRLLINPGGIMRDGRDTVNRKPVVYLIDIDAVKIVDIIPIPILPSKEVFNFDKIEEDKRREEEKERAKEKFDEYIRLVKESKKLRPDFRKNLKEVITSIEVSDRIFDKVKGEVDSIMEAVKK